MGIEPEIILLLTICLLGFTIRLIPRLKLKHAYAGDTFFHLHMARSIRENGFKIPRKIPRVILEHEYTYPYLYHLLLSYFPVRYRMWMERATGAIFDTLNLLVIYFFFKWLIDFYGIVTTPYMPLYMALLMAVYPGLLVVGVGPRAYNGSPRVLAQFLYILHMVSFFYYQATGSAAALIISLLAASLLLVAAKFGVQVFVFFGLILGIFLTPFYFVVMGLTLALSIVITRGRVLKVLYGHLRHSEFYTKYVRFKGIATGFTTDLAEVKIYAARFYRNFRDILRGKFMNFIEWFTSERFFIHYIVISYPQVLLLLFIYDDLDMSLYYNKFLFVWFIASLVWFILTSISFFKFLGEAERYLEYSLPATLFLSALYLVESGRESVIVIFAVYSFVIYVVNYRIFVKRYEMQNKAYEADEEFFEKVKQLKEGSILPINHEWQILYRSNLPLLTYGANTDLNKISMEQFTYIFYNTHSPNKHIEDFVQKFNVRYILATYKDLQNYVEEVFKDKEKFFNLTEKKIEGKNFLLLEIIK